MVKIRNNKKGSILLTTIIILSFISVLGMNIIVYILSRTTNVTLESDRLKALYLAEGALAQAVYELKSNQDKDKNGLGNIFKTPVGGGFYSAEHNFDTTTIVGIGEYNHIKRKVQIKYTTL